jgi:uncharacterized protein YdhG (YjbR/CyaY superfamily)
MFSNMDTSKAETIDEYIQQFPEEVQLKLQTIRNTIRKIVPEATERISYGIPTFALTKNLVHFAAFKNHIGFYALPTANEKFREALSGYKIGKGSIQFPINEELPMELIEKLVRYRITELQNK